MNFSYNRLTIPLLGLPRSIKITIVICVDISLCVLSAWLAFYLRLGAFLALSEVSLIPIAVSVLLAVPIFIAFGLYRAIFRYSGWLTLSTVGTAIFLYGLLYTSIFTAIGISGVPRTVGIIQPILLLLFVGASRVVARILLSEYYQRDAKKLKFQRILIYGAGEAGHEGRHEAQ